MTHETHGRHRKLKILLAVAAIGVAAGLLAVYIGYRRLAHAPEQLAAVIGDQAKLSLGKIRQTATRDGKTEWRLDAASAQYLEAGSKVLLKELTVVFYSNEDRSVTLSATDGVLNTESNDIEVSGDVTVENEEYTLTTASLHYRHDTRTISSDHPVTIERKTGGRLSADALSFDLNTNRVLMEGNVTGVFDAPADS